MLSASRLRMSVPHQTLFENVDLHVEPGECVAVMGASGSGKTSLLNCLCGIVVPNSGSVVVNDQELTSLGAGRRAEFRLRHIGIVFQFGELLPELTALENVALPSRLMGMERKAARHRAAEWLERLALTSHMSSHPESLSGGEIQRIGIARALAHSPALVLADEPTGMLDEENTLRVTELLVDSARELGAAIVIATHDPSVAAAADVSLRIRGGALVPNPADEGAGAAQC